MGRAAETVIIGAGHNGLVAAACLAAAGRKVVVLERRDILGGAACTEEIFPGYRVDSGAHKLGGLSRQVVSELGLADHGLELLSADPTTFTPVESGPPLVLWRDPNRTAEGIRELAPADAERWRRFTELIAKAAELLETAWHMTPPDVTGGDLADLWASARLAKKLRGLGRRDMVEVVRILPMSVYELVEEWFASDAVRGTLAACAVAGLSQGPMGGGTAYTLLHHHVGGAAGVIRPTVRVKGGIGRLSEALAAVCRQRGVEIRTGAEVSRILVEQGAVCGVALTDGSEVAAGRVVSSLDARLTFLHLLEPAAIGLDFVRKVDNIRYRGVSAKVHLALAGLPDFPCLQGEGPHLAGMISISPSLEYVERAWDDAKYGRVSSAPCLEVSIPSLADPSLAPAGKHLASIAFQYAPFVLREGGWDEAAAGALADVAVRTLTRWAPNVESLIEDRHVLTPLDLQDRFGLTEGNIYQGEMSLDQLFFMRPVPGASRYRTPVRGLYLCGSAAHPGGGVTGVPGLNAAREILRG